MTTGGASEPTSTERYATDLEQAILGRSRTPQERALGDPGVAVRAYSRWDQILERFDAGTWRSTGALVCCDCDDFPFVVDTVAHDLWHVEQAAHLDTLQQVMFR